MIYGRTSENCKSHVLQDKYNIEIILSPDFHIFTLTKQISAKLIRIIRLHL